MLLVYSVPHFYSQHPCELRYVFMRKISKQLFSNKSTCFFLLPKAVIYFRFCITVACCCTSLECSCNVLLRQSFVIPLSELLNDGGSLSKLGAELNFG